MANFQTTFDRQTSTGWRNFATLIVEVFSLLRAISITAIVCETISALLISDHAPRQFCVRTD
jgi:hypothetical protein